VTSFHSHESRNVQSCCHSESISTEWIMNIHLLGETWLLDLAMDTHLLDAVQPLSGIHTWPSCPPHHFHLMHVANDRITLDDLDAPSSGALVVLPGQHQLNLLPVQSPVTLH
ncbi:hypothetical protein DYB34_002889, partial [Aphanomyces astaci]